VSTKQPCVGCSRLVTEQSEYPYPDCADDCPLASRWRREHEEQPREHYVTAIDCVLAHLKGYDSLIASGMPAEGVLHLILYNVKAMREWTPEHAAEVLAEVTAPHPKDAP